MSSTCAVSCGEPIPPTPVFVGVNTCCVPTAVDPAYVTPYVPKCCPTPVNMNPRRNQSYLTTTPASRSEPLSHAEYLRMKKAANNASLSTNPVQIKAGVYTTTLWTAAAPSCCQTPIPIPAVHPGGRALSEGLRIETVGTSGHVSKWDTTNRDASATTLKNRDIVTKGCNNGGTDIYPGR